MLVKGAPGEKSLYQLIVELLIYVYIFAQPLQLSYKAHGHRLTFLSNHLSYTTTVLL